MIASGMLHLVRASLMWIGMVWQVIHLYVTSGGCLGQWGFSFPVVALALPSQRHL
jgi:hypothetical protein